MNLGWAGTMLWRSGNAQQLPTHNRPDSDPDIAATATRHSRRSLGTKTPT